MRENLILDIPLVVQEKLNDCGPSSLKMVLDYFNGNISKQEIEKLSLSDESGVCWTLGLGVAACKLGFKIEMYTKSLNLDQSNYELDFYKENADSINETIKKLGFFKEEIKKLDGKLYEKTMSLDEILNNVDENKVPIIILDWGIVDSLKDKNPLHFVVITGFDENHVYVNEPGKYKQKNFKIKKDTFNKARKSQGTDEDILFIQRF